jgi:hypothetical protein
MAAHVEFDPLDAPATLGFGPNGYIGTRYANVTGLMPSGPRFNVSLLAVAIILVRKAGADPGRDSYPGIISLPVNDLFAAFMQGEQTKVRVTINYKVPEISTDIAEPNPTAPAQLEIGATIQSRQTIWDGEGKQIVLEYATGTGDDATIIKQTGTITEKVPATVIRYRRRQGPNAGSAILEKANQVVGTVNSRPFGREPVLTRQWMCTSHLGTSDDGGIWYDVVTEFQRSIDNKLGKANEFVSGWDPVAIYIDSATGEPPSDVINLGTGALNGIRRIKKPREIDFVSELNLPA